MTVSTAMTPVMKYPEYFAQYSNTKIYDNKALLETMLACYGARKEAIQNNLENNWLNVYEDNTLRITVLKNIILSRMEGGVAYE